MTEYWILCEGCGEQSEVTARGFAHGARYCSKRCQELHPCLECGSRATGVLCDRCRRRRERRRKLDREMGIVVRWQMGKTAAAIADEMGLRRRSVTAEIALLRRKGYKLDYRRLDMVRGDDMASVRAAKVKA